MFEEFKKFISKGNVIDLAVGVIIGKAFADIVSAFTNSFIQPLLSLIGGTSIHGTIPLGKSGQAIDYGSFISAIINFLIIAIVLFLIVKIFNTFDKKNKEQLEKISSKLPHLKSKKSKVDIEPDTKLCPYCLSEIPYKATKCAHCASDLTNIDENSK